MHHKSAKQASPIYSTKDASGMSATSDKKTTRRIGPNSNEARPDGGHPVDR
jgi:hypothetical protein